MTMAITERCLTNMGLKPTDAGYLKDWTTYPPPGQVKNEALAREKDQPDPAAGKKTRPRIVKLKKDPRCPAEIMAWCEVEYRHGEWKRVLRALHKYSRYQKRNEDKYYPGKSTRRNRIYAGSQQWLADRLGLSRKTINEWLGRLESAGVVYVCYHGYIDRGASIYELAYNQAHRRINKQRTEARKTKSLLVGVTPGLAPSSRCNPWGG